MFYEDNTFFIDIFFLIVNMFKNEHIKLNQNFLLKVE